MKRYVLSLVILSLVSGLAAANGGREAGQWIVRAGVGGIFPKSNNFDLGGGATLDVDDGYSLTINGTYMITNAIGIELLASTPFSHDIDAKVPGAGSAKIGETKHLPPTLTLQWHTPAIGRIQPYLGIGLNWTIFFDEEIDPAVGSDLSLDDSVGVAPQLGFDFNINDSWSINADLRWINIETDAKLDGVELGTVEIDPWVFALNVGYRF